MSSLKLNTEARTKRLTWEVARVGRRLSLADLTTTAEQNIGTMQKRASDRVTLSTVRLAISFADFQSPYSYVALTRRNG